MKIVLAGRRLPSVPLGLAAGLWFVAYFIVRALLEDETLASSTRIIISLIPVPFFLMLLLSFVRAILSMDELQKRIQLEALAVAFPAAVFILTTLGLLQHAVELSLKDWSYTHISFFVVAIYFLSIGFVSGRYQ